MMLDWLSSYQGASTTGDSQILDAPETPAPIFAYRALKGILFGSPDYDDQGEDKENIAPAHSSLQLKESLPNESTSSKTSSSPLQSKSPDRRARGRSPLSASPRKRRQPSPAKSILRTPGIPTPRRQKINVTFKDVRPSVSPSGVATQLLAAQNETKAAPRTQESISSDAEVTKDVHPKHLKADGAVEKPPTSVNDMNCINAYRKSTEREMKRLVRYSQRMREYARMSQQENVALREERDELRRELEEMRKTKADGRGISDQQAIQEVDVTAAKSRRRSGLAGEKWSRDSASEARPLHKSHTTKVTRLHERSASGRDSSIGEPRTELREDKVDQKEARSTPVQESGRVGGALSMKRAAATAQLPPDRLAAAKERLRVKSDERRRALSTVVG